ncbi:hypothetical protein [Streptacidiphilus albus]|uniref:hypothetical protein n=1 Tax=Streptacidiphilus albus TaxID=105425 RepID=UPI00054B3FB1|nr:hypothetical protein [Streptacidiphilus albus]
MTRIGKYRWRSRIRVHLPWFILNLEVAAKGKRDCGAHEWYNHDNVVAHCYHCRAGEHPWSADLIGSANAAGAQSELDR